MIPHQHDEVFGGPKGSPKLSKNTPKEEILKLARPCNMCGHCCEFGSGILTEEDITLISKHLDISREDFTKNFLEPITRFNTTLHKLKTDKPRGQCIFYAGSRGCKINHVKPLNCKVANCNEHAKQLNLWFNLTHFINKNNDQSVREYAFYLKTGGETLEGFELNKIVKDKEKLKKILKVGGL